MTGPATAPNPPQSDHLPASSVDVIISNCVINLSADKDAVADEFEAFKTAYWDLQISWVEAVLRARDDFERGMLNAVKARAAQMDVTRGPETIMSKVK